MLMLVSVEVGGKSPEAFFEPLDLGNNLPVRRRVFEFEVEPERNTECEEISLSNIFPLDHNGNPSDEPCTRYFEHALIEPRGHPVVISGDDEFGLRHLIFSGRRT